MYEGHFAHRNEAPRRVTAGDSQSSRATSIRSASLGTKGPRAFSGTAADHRETSPAPPSAAAFGATGEGLLGGSCSTTFDGSGALVAIAGGAAGGNSTAFPWHAQRNVITTHETARRMART
ncbi:hypothetical protein A7982_12475 [Minicystis rosea]|nr:hypothetical protein A7982_12475 [Minicystis rosea]